MTDRKSRLIKPYSRRAILKGSLATTAGLGALSLGGVGPLHFVRDAWADEMPIGNFPKATSGATVTFGFNVPQTGPYADEGEDELQGLQARRQAPQRRGRRRHAQHHDAQGASRATASSARRSSTSPATPQTKSDAARASAKQMIEKDGVIMITGGSSSGVAVAVQSLCQEAGIIFMCGLTHSNDTTGKDRRRYGFRHFFNAYMSGQALGPVLAEEYGKDRNAYHLTADYTWGWTQQKSIKDATEKLGWKTVATVLTPLGAPRLLAVHHAGAEFRRRRADPEPLRRGHGPLADPGGPVRPARQDGQRQAVRDRRAAHLRADGAGRRRCHQGHPRHLELELEAARRRPPRRFDQVVRRGIRLPARRRRRRPATCRPCSMPMPSRRPAPSIRRKSSRRWKASSSTAWATARPSTAPPTTSASRTCWWCRATRTRRTSSTCSNVVKVVPRAQVEYDPNIPDFNPDGKANSARTCRARSPTDATAGRSSRAAGRFRYAARVVDGVDYARGMLGGWEPCWTQSSFKC